MEISATSSYAHQMWDELELKAGGLNGDVVSGCGAGLLRVLVASANSRHGQRPLSRGWLNRGNGMTMDADWKQVWMVVESGPSDSSLLDPAISAVASVGAVRAVSGTYRNGTGAVAGQYPPSAGSRDRSAEDTHRQRIPSCNTLHCAAMGVG
eukprot:gene11984-biopygen15459